MVLSRLPTTLELASLAIALTLGVLFAVASVYWRGRWPEFMVDIFCAVALAIPDFLWGLTFILVLGEIVEIGACERVFGDPRHAYTKELLQAIPLPDVDPDWVNAVQ